jgi:hypothetical protein
MSNDEVSKTTAGEITSHEVKPSLSLSPEYQGMIDHINTVLPAVKRDTENFYKSDTQFKNVTLDVTDVTPLSSLRHVLAVIEKTKLAVEEGSFGLRKKQIELKKKQKELEESTNELDTELLEVEILEMTVQQANGENYIRGAIRKLSFFTTQYQAMMERLGIVELTEEEIERNESKHHIMTALKQALTSARTRNGVIDEGNQIYLFDLGINGAVAQQEIYNYLNMEKEIFEKGLEPSHELTVRWLEACAEKFAGSGERYAESRGFITLDTKSLVKQLPTNNNSKV